MIIIDDQLLLDVLSGHAINAVADPFEQGACSPLVVGTTGWLHHHSGRLTRFQASEKAFFRRSRTGIARVPYPPGSILRQPDHAASLRAIAKEGPAGFYNANGVSGDGTGDVADFIVAEMEAERDRGRAALLTAEDLRSYAPVWREPLEGSYHRHEILTMPPPTWGFVVQEVLNIIEARPDLDLRTIPHSTANWAHVLTEAHKIALADGLGWIGDPAFVTVPIEELTGKRYAKSRARNIRLDEAQDFGAGTFDGKSTKTSARGEAPHTSHISVIDAAGNAVALTCSLGPAFGSAVVPAGAGFALHSLGNFSLYDPAHPNDDDPNLAAPGKRPATAHAPTMVVRDGRAVLVLGAVGGDFIPMGVVNVIVNAIDYRLDDRYPDHVARAVDAARVQADPVPVENKGRRLVIEDGRIHDDVIAELRTKGHTVNDTPGVFRRDRNYDFMAAHVEVAGDLGATRFAVTESRYLGSLDGGPMAQP